ncbi:MAG: class I SAM-dependent methyltransferase [Mariprofundaceae bacterium]|nr:class I SAM-dependent methyltransferase [Mariprofundaceae bacterium]
MQATTLLYQHALSLPEVSAGSWAVGIHNAAPHPLLELMAGHSSKLTLQQHFRPLYLELEQTGFHPELELQGEFDLLLLRPSKNKTQTLSWMGSAMLQLREGGRLLACCANRHGARSYEKALATLCGHVGSISKSRCRLLETRRTADTDVELARRWVKEGLPRHIDALGMQSQPGLFSWEKADAGSMLLLSYLPEKMEGRGMDLCCGYGFLARHLLLSHADISQLLLVDADHQALDCARENLQPFSKLARFHWLDAASEPLPSGTDWIVCNPPFHRSHEQDMALGQAIIRSACNSLKSGGRLYLVANRHLPYEAVVRKHMRRDRIFTQEGGYKIIEGIK